MSMLDSDFVELGGLSEYMADNSVISAWRAK